MTGSVGLNFIKCIWSVCMKTTLSSGCKANMLYRTLQIDIYLNMQSICSIAGSMKSWKRYNVLANCATIRPISSDASTPCQCPTPSRISSLFSDESVPHLCCNIMSASCELRPRCTHSSNIFLQPSRGAELSSAPAITKTGEVMLL